MKILKKRKTAYIIYFGIAIFFFIVSTICSCFENNEKEQKSYSAITKGESNVNFRKKYKGIVIEKFNDRNNHNYETIEIKLSSGSYFYLHPYWKDKTGFYEYVQKDDSIFKEDWGFKFRVKRKNIDSTFIIHPDYINHK